MTGMTQAEYARHRGVSRQAIGKLIESGKLPPSVFVQGDGGKRLIDAAAADFALGETRERVLLDTGDEDADGGGADPTFGSNAGAVRPGNQENIAALTKARTATEVYRARTAQLEYEQKIGKLLSIEDVTFAMEKCASLIVRELEQLPNFADEIAAALTRDGIQGARVTLKNIARNVRSALEQNMRLLGSEEATARQDAAS